MSHFARYQEFASTDVAIEDVQLPALEIDIGHIVCCVDDDIAMCGENVAGLIWDEEGAATCVNCVTNDESDICPKTKKECEY